MADINEDGIINEDDLMLTTHQNIQRSPEKLVFKRGCLNRIAAIKFIPVMVLLILCCNLVSRRTSGRHLTQAVVNQVENNQLTREATEQNYQTLAASFRDLTISTCIDSITETTLVKTENLRTTRDQTISGQPVTKAGRIRTVLTVMMAALLGLWIYYVFRSKRLF